MEMTCSRRSTASYSSETRICLHVLQKEHKELSGDEGSKVVSQSSRVPDVCESPAGAMYISNLDLTPEGSNPDQHKRLLFAREQFTSSRVGVVGKKTVGRLHRTHIRCCRSLANMIVIVKAGVDKGL